MKKYYLGLDIGTDSVGWAVTDTNYKIHKKGKKDLIGVRVFDDGQTAEERRINRANRRRTNRKKQRIILLQELFATEIYKIDPYFFLRLKESMFHKEDKDENQLNTLFNDKNFSDKDYHKKYPTIYHLRKDIINGNVTDPRLLYLGIEHIVKTRGHFLFPDVDFGEVTNFSTAYNALNQYLIENNDQFALEIQETNNLENILKDSSLGVNEKEKRIKELISGKPNENQKTIISLIVGKTVKMSKIFPDIELEEDFAKKSICFKKEIETIYGEILANIDTGYEIIDYAKSIYDWSMLVDILNTPEKKDNITLSDAKIYKYNLHKKQLKTLKSMVKEYLTHDAYKEIFSANNISENYFAYVKNNSSNKNKILETGKENTQENLNKYILKKFNNFEKIELLNDEHIYIKEELEKNALLPKLRVKDNSVIPYQVHLEELKQILNNNIEKFAFLKEEQDGFTVKEKIEQIFMYKIPYYVGPLNNHSEQSWIVRKSGKIKPWNFEEIVDTDASAEAFIRRMTNKCTYLNGKDVIPKQSLLYSKFLVLNELNNLKLNGQSISVELKQDIYENLFKKQSKITESILKKYLVKNSIADRDVVITGIDKDFKSNLDSYIKFNNILGNVEKNNDIIEDIIRWITLFGGEKKIIKSKILKSGYSFSDEQLKQILALRFKEWGRLSKELLTEIYPIDEKTGEIVPIIDLMYNSNLNLMQILSDEYAYINIINDSNQEENGDKITYENIAKLYCSPAVKKGVWQAVKIVNEIEKIMGGKPEKLFIEVTRGDQEKKPTTSRKKNLIELYNSIKKEYSNIYQELIDKDEKDLRQRRLYLYFTQLGRCAYTNNKIDFNKLFTTDYYDIEHIYPRSIVKDDSIHNNLVLVEKVSNSKKSNEYPLSAEYRNETNKANWKLWLDKKLITQEKYKRLTRSEDLTDKELEGFIKRQIVETSQSSKAVAQLMENYYKNANAEVVYVKAGNVSDFRSNFKIVKSREINDYHHAQDAYLNIVVGNVFDTKFTRNFYQNISKRFYTKDSKEKYSMKPEVLYSYDVKGKEGFAWQKGNDGTIETVKNQLNNAKILFTRKSMEGTGVLFDLTIYKKGKGEFAVKNPTDTTSKNAKLTDLSKYGGYKSIKGSYFCVVEYTQKNNIIRSIEYVPIYLAKQIEDNPSLLNDYLKKELAVETVKIILPKLKINSLLNINGMPLHLSGRTGSQLVYKGAVQLKLSEEDYKYIYSVEKFITKSKNVENLKVENVNNAKSAIQITKQKNSIIYNLLTEKLLKGIYSTHLKAQGATLINAKEKFEELSIENQCQLLVNLLTLFKCNPAKANLELIGGAKTAGTLITSKKISNMQKCILINQSITGVYENRIDLLK